MLWRGLRRRIPCGHVLRGCCSAPRRMCFFIKASDVFNFYKLYFHITFLKGDVTSSCVLERKASRKTFSDQQRGFTRFPVIVDSKGFSDCRWSTRPTRHSYFMLYPSELSDGQRLMRCVRVFFFQDVLSLRNITGTTMRIKIRILTVVILMRMKMMMR